MTRRGVFAVFVCSAVGAGLWFDAGQPVAQTPADLVLVNGKVITVDSSDAIAQAIAVTGGRIVAVGTTEAIRARAGSATQVIDLGGRTVTPGLIDTHVHFPRNAQAIDPFILGLERLAQRGQRRRVKRRAGQGNAQFMSLPRIAQLHHARSADL